jgi:hypothetical protein
VARQLLTFLVSPRKISQRRRPQSATPSVFPALLDKSGGCGTCAMRSNSPRRNPLTRLRYSVAAKGKVSQNNSHFKSANLKTRHARVGGHPAKRKYPAQQTTLKFRFVIPCAPPRTVSSERGFRRALFEPVGRVAQPRLLLIFRGNPKGGKPGSPSFWLLFLGEARKSD